MVLSAGLANRRKSPRDAMIERKLGNGFQIERLENAIFIATAMEN